MAVGIHIARVGYFAVNKHTGQVINKNDPATKISDVLQTEHQHRIIVDTTNAPNSTGSPTVDDYLRLEAAQDFVVYHMDQNMIVTYDQGALNSAT
jgi:hypothetical protein